MGRASTRQNKNIYQLRREELGLTREKASDVVAAVSPERIGKIECGKSLAHPDEVLAMADGYRMPELCNYYCANECPIGRRYVPEIKVKDLSQIVLEMLASLNSMDRAKNRLIEITADGSIEEDEIRDFVRIQEELEKISVTVETLQLWVEKKLADKEINADLYNEHKKG